MRIVDKQQISTTASQSRADATSEVLSSHVCVPSSGGLAVNCKGDCWEYLFVFVIVNDVSNFAAKVHGKVCGVGNHQHLLIRVSTYKPSGEINGDEL